MYVVGTNSAIIWYSLFLMLAELPNDEVNAFWFVGDFSHFAASVVVSEYKTLPFLSFFAALKVKGLGKSSSWSAMSSTAKFALVTRSFSVSVEAEGGVFSSSKVMSICLAEIMFLAITSAISGSGAGLAAMLAYDDRFIACGVVINSVGPCVVWICGIVPVMFWRFLMTLFEISDAILSI
jgi:hypothetical protein